MTSKNSRAAFRGKKTYEHPAFETKQNPEINRIKKKTSQNVHRGSCLRRSPHLKKQTKLGSTHPPRMPVTRMT